eukprot:CAMPEP_0115567156 /NCGR_PEP_ID=MMETSP0271-20121206/103961_1 /TAXON_ID=71861 /ORGANISM="Scrippsiella trochoidea, Strain CCMP3099" /LENGTH=50 /DNA_ID=CAMNT_0003001499 /DNA_START=396 /DNA_END=548 /DNA_ORIENTATION=+
MRVAVTMSPAAVPGPPLCKRRPEVDCNVAEHGYAAQVHAMPTSARPPETR